MTTIQTGSQACTSTPPKRNFQKADTYAIVAGAKWLQIPVQELATTYDIDNYADYLVCFTQELISQTVLYRAPSAQAQAWWTPEVSEAIAEERRAHHQWSRTYIDNDWDIYTAALKAKRQRKASAKQAHWRQSVHEAAVSTEGIWKLAKWACTKSHLPPKPAKMLDLQWQGAQLGAVSGKAKALYERFYPETEADLEDIIDRDFQHNPPGRTLEMS